jgi:hypothetical protein
MEKQAGSGGGNARVAEALTRRWWPLRSRATMRTTLPAVCVVAAVTAAAILLTAGGWGSSPNEMATSSFFDGTLPYKQYTYYFSTLLHQYFSANKQCFSLEQINISGS